MKSYHSKRVLQNVSELDRETAPTIKITEGEPDWKAGYEAWLNGSLPTDSPEWERGVYLIFEPTEYLDKFQEAQTKRMPSWVKVGSIVVAIVFALALLFVYLVH